MIRTEAFAQVAVASAAELEAWLAAHHGQVESVWLVTWKKHTGERYLSTGAVLDALIAWGWVDGIRRKLDADRTMQLIAPRRMQAWAQSYKDRAARLEADGRMRPPGRAAIAESRRLGLWDAMADVDALRVPDDLRAALEASGPGAGRFDGAARSYRRNGLRWIELARTAPTREKRIAAAAAASAAGEKLPQM